MNRMDWGMEEEAERLGAQIPSGTRGGGGGAQRPAAAPAAAAPAAVGARDAGAKLRRGTEGALNASLGAVESGTNFLTRPVRAAVDTAGQFAAGVLDRPAPAPVPALRLPRADFSGAGAAPRAAAPRGGKPMAVTNRDAGPAARVAPAATPAPAAAPAGVTKTVGPDGVVTYTGSPGASPAVSLGTFQGDQGFQTQGLLPGSGSPPRPALSRAAPAGFDGNAAVAPAVAGQRGVALQVRRDATEFLNPMSSEAEVLRRAENAAGSAFLKGRPGARNAIVGGILGQLGAGNAASRQFQRDAGAALATGAAGEIQEGLAAQAFRGQARLQRQAQAGQADLMRLAQGEGKEVVASDGSLLLRRGDRASPVTDATGAAVRLPLAPAAGAITPKDLLEAFTKEREAITGSLGSAEEKASALAALEANPLYRPLLGGGQAASAPLLADFLSAARAANPGVSDSELTEYFNQAYGGR